MASLERIEALIVRMDALLRELGEHVDHAQLMVSWDEEGKTLDVQRGIGNWYARQGLAHSFINQDVAQDSAVALSRYLPPPPRAD